MKYNTSYILIVSTSLHCIRFCKIGFLRYLIFNILRQIWYNHSESNENIYSSKNLYKKGISIFLHVLLRPKYLNEIMCIYPNQHLSKWRQQRIQQPNLINLKCQNDKSWELPILIFQVDFPTRYYVNNLCIS